MLKIGSLVAKISRHLQRDVTRWCTKALADAKIAVIRSQEQVESSLFIDGVGQVRTYFQHCRPHICACAIKKKRWLE